MIFYKQWHCFSFIKNLFIFLKIFCLGKLVHVGKLPLVFVGVNTNGIELNTFFFFLSKF